MQGGEAAALGEVGVESDGGNAQLRQQQAQHVAAATGGAENYRAAD